MTSGLTRRTVLGNFVDPVLRGVPGNLRHASPSSFRRSCSFEGASEPIRLQSLDGGGPSDADSVSTRQLGQFLQDRAVERIVPVRIEADGPLADVGFR